MCVLVWCGVGACGARGVCVSVCVSVLVLCVCGVVCGGGACRAWCVCVLVCVC